MKFCLGKYLLSDHMIKLIHANAERSGTDFSAQNFADHNFSDNRFSKWNSVHSDQAVTYTVKVCEYGYDNLTASS